MPIPNFKPSTFPEANQPGRRDVQALHAALEKSRIPVAEEEIQRGEVGDATKDAIKQFQRRPRLRVDGVIRPKTVAGLQSEIAYAFFARNKARTGNLHEKLPRLGYQLDADEVKGRPTARVRRRPSRIVQTQRCRPADGRMSPELFDKKVGAVTLDKRFTTKRQIYALQRSCSVPSESRSWRFASSRPTWGGRNLA